MLTEKQIMTAYELKRQGKPYRHIADAIGLDGRTQHSQVVTALKYYVMGYQAAIKKTEPLLKAQYSPWLERLLGFCACVIFYLFIEIIANLVGTGE